MTKTQIAILSTALVAISALATTINDVTLSGGDNTISQNGSALDHIQVGCSTPVKSIVISGSFVDVSGCEVTGSKSHAVKITGHDVIIDGVTVHDAITEGGVYPNCIQSQWGSGIKAERGSYNVTIRNSTVYHVCGEGIASTMSHDVTITGNTVYDNHPKAVNLYIDNSYKLVASTNTVYCTKAINPVGISIGEEFYNGWGAQLKDITITGNSVTGCSVGIMAFQSDVSGVLTNVTISNNYIPSAQSQAVSLDNTKNSNVLISNNQWYKSPWIRSAAGVTLTGNVFVGSATVTPSSTTKTPTRTKTPLPVVTITPAKCPLNFTVMEDSLLLLCYQVK